ncbi:MAG: response regulator [Acidobacteria bacterium]|nr:response regulator [Acidobacteriota bacterium]
MRILIAEDEPVSRLMLETNLKKWGHEVIVTTNGAEAWAEFQKAEAPNLAILDVMMPEMSGLEVCRQIRSMGHTLPPYLILLTGKQEKEDVITGIRSGANDYLTKPFHNEELRLRLGVGVQMVELQRSLADRVQELEEALSQVKQLQGILPICSYCKKIRDDENYWQRVESYISKHTETRFSHCICPDCYAAICEPQIRQLQERRDAASQVTDIPHICSSHTSSDF